MPGLFFQVSIYLYVWNVYVLCIFGSCSRIHADIATECATTDSLTQVYKNIFSARYFIRNIIKVVNFLFLYFFSILIVGLTNRFITLQMLTS